MSTKFPTVYELFTVSLLFYFYMSKLRDMEGRTSLGDTAKM